MNASHETRHMLDAADLRALAEARVLLERPSLAARLSSFVGSPLEKGMARLPASWRERIGGLAHDALMKAMDTAAKTLQPAAQPASPRLHKLLGSVSGAGGGAFGVAGLTVEIPLSTVLIMRSILDIARAEGEDIGSAQARLAALEVFALGGNASSDDAAEAGYYAVRAALATTVSEAARHFAQKGLSSEGAPALAPYESDRFEQFWARPGAVAATVGTPEPVIEFDLATLSSVEALPRRHDIVRTATADAIVDGVCVWFEAQFDDETTLTTSPLAANTSWGNRMFRLDREVHRGETLALRVEMDRLVDASTWSVRDA